MDYRTERACLNVYKSDYLLDKIFKYLELTEQVNLAGVCKRFEYILVNFEWAETCCQINLHKTPYASIITTEEWEQQETEALTVRDMETNEVKRSKVALTHRQCNDFLTLNANNITSLNVYSEYYNLKQEMGVSFKNVHIFRNLTSVTYYRLILSDEQMQLLAENCKKLEKLHILECYNEYLRPLIPGEHLNLQNVYSMRKLQKLALHGNPNEESSLKSYHLQEIFIKLSLKCLILKNFIIDDNDADTTEHLANTLEVLDMGIITMRFWPSFMHYLNHFVRLKELHINVSDYNTTINVQIIDILATKCSQLEKLSLEKCDLQVDDFGVLKSLKHLSLNSCGGLTFANFQQILGALKLKTFTMINTRLYGNINHIFVSETLEMIIIDTIRFVQISDAFQKCLNNFENLHTLKWFNGDIHDNWIIEKCPKLKYLHIPNPYLLRRIVFTMKSLKELTFTSFSGLSWCFILILIRNLTLQRLCLQTSEIIDDDKEIPYNACGIKTTLKFITVPYNVFKTAQAFWIDLLYLNDKLCISIYGKHEDLLDGRFLNELIAIEKFRRRVKVLKICGFKLDCNDLHENFDQVIHQLNKNTSYYRGKNVNFIMQM